MLAKSIKTSLNDSMQFKTPVTFPTRLSVGSKPKPEKKSFAFPL